MEGILVIAVLGLAVALLAAMMGLRRRSEELDAVLVAESERRAAEAATAAAAARRPSTRPEARSLPGDLLPVGVVHLDADRRVDHANARAHALLGIAAGRLAGRTVMEAFLDARVEELVDGLPDRGSGTVEIRAATQRAGADPQLAVVRVHPSSVEGTWIVLEDVTELRRLQQIRAEFIENLSHELRTPLATVSLLAETLGRDAESPEVPARMRDRIARVEVETGHLVQMVNELLDLSRIEGGTRLDVTDDVDLARLAAASAERVRLFAERQGVALVVRAEPPVPLVRGDEERLGQVFVNLVHNAVKFSPDGGEVAIEVGVSDGDVVARVIDHGIGISAEDQARIFERFYKADRARVRGGTGLGLAIARHVVERHGGRIWVESEPGRGSTFAFAIPGAAAEFELPAAELAAPAAAATVARPAGT